MTQGALKIREAARADLRRATDAVRARAPEHFDRALEACEETSRRTRRARSPLAVLRRIAVGFLMLFGYAPVRH